MMLELVIQLPWQDLAEHEEGLFWSVAKRGYPRSMSAGECSWHYHSKQHTGHTLDTDDDDDN